LAANCLVIGTGAPALPRRSGLGSGATPTPPCAAAQLTAYETQLQASCSALAKIQSLSLLDYLR
tara:strand:+ start:2450 stop:2641 length:192 start_codon:yes stop_codon:yes gene_type:complete